MANQGLRRSTALPDVQQPRKSSQSASLQARQKRVEEFEQERLGHPDAYEACMGLIQADQLSLSFALGDAIKNYMGNGELTLDELMDVEPHLHLLLRLHRQIERYRRLELRLMERQQIAAPNSGQPAILERELDKPAKPTPK